MTAEQEGFAKRWSRKKREVAVTLDPADPEIVVSVPLGEPLAASDSPVVASETATSCDEKTADSTVESLADGPDDEVNTETAPALTDADMPPLESLDGDSDVSGFFSKGVSNTLRQAALRRIFSAPRYNVRDGLNDYDGDYTVFEPLGDTITSDMKFHAARKEAARLAALEEEKQLEAQRLAETSSDELESENSADSQIGQQNEPDQEASAQSDEEHSGVAAAADVSESEDIAAATDDKNPKDAKLRQAASLASTADTNAPDDSANPSETLPT